MENVGDSPMRSDKVEGTALSEGGCECLPPCASVNKSLNIGQNLFERDENYHNPIMQSHN